MKSHRLVNGSLVLLAALISGSATNLGTAADCPNVKAILEAGNEAKWTAVPYGGSCDNFSFSYGSFTWNNSQSNQQCVVLTYQPECKTEVAGVGFRTTSIAKDVKAWVFQCTCVSSLLGVCLDFECASSGPTTVDVKTCFESFFCAVSYVIPPGPGPTTGNPAPRPGPTTGNPVPKTGPTTGNPSSSTGSGSN